MYWNNFRREKITMLMQVRMMMMMMMTHDVA
jgi:hypothetical protein